MATIKLSAWNIEHARNLLGQNLNLNLTARKAGVKAELAQIDADILCITEGAPSLAQMKQFANEILDDRYVPIDPGGSNGQRGEQWIWFLVKQEWAAQCSILPVETWHDFSGGKNWRVHHWGSFEEVSHSHYRTPQVLVMDISGQRVEFIGVHFKSKYINQGSSMWNSTNQETRDEFILESLKARVKLATEAANVRRYIDRKFEQIEKPAIFVLGDMNDGPGKELFEEKYLFFDLIANIQGDVFAATRFLNHCLFDFPDELRWSAIFNDFVTNESNKKILIDHILFTQPLVNWNLNICVEPNAGYIEHEIHDLVNASLNRNQKTSDHRPVSLKISTR